MLFLKRKTKYESKMKKINLVVILPSYAGGGAEKVVLDFLEFYDKNILNCTLILINAEGPLKSRNKNYNIINLNKKRLRSSILKLIWTIRAIKPDIIFSTFPHITIVLILLKKLFFRKIKFIAREPNLASISLKSSGNVLLKFLHNNLMSTSDKVIVTSNAMYLDSTKLGIPAKKLNIIRNPVNVSQLREKVTPIRLFKKGVNLVFVGRLVYQKGLDRILPLIVINKNIYLTVIGEGPELNKIKNMVKKYKLESHVKFLGYINPPYDYIAGADFLILPSRWEGLPNVALEALAVGTRVLSFKEIVGLNDYIYKNNIIFCKDDEDMKIFLTKLHNSKNYNNSKIKNSLLKNKNSSSDFSNKLTNLFKEVMIEN